jgi:hypothetical protein
MFRLQPRVTRRKQLTCQSPQNFVLNLRNILVYVVIWKLNNDSRFHSGNMGSKATVSLCNTPKLYVHIQKPSWHYSSCM